MQERMPAFLRLGLWNCWRRYFSMRAVTPPLPYLSKHRHYLLVQFPHACCPLACWLVLGMAGLPQSGVPRLLHLCMQLPPIDCSWHACTNKAHASVDTNAWMHGRTYPHAPTHTCLHTYMRMHTRTRTHMHTHKHMNVHARTNKQARSYAPIVRTPARQYVCFHVGMWV